MLGARRTITAHLAARLASRAQRPSQRLFHNSASIYEAKLFDMPSMSPTMEEGGIVEWKVQVGDAFSAGDVLLEIETDKAEIAVEAADDGVMGKILVAAGEKGITVGKPIAVLAEQGDDIASIDVDALLAAKSPKSSPSAQNSEKTSTKKSTQSASTPQSTYSGPTEPVPESSSQGNHGKAPLPVAQRLMHENKLSASAIKGTGPHGRITKGDVLAHLGKISAQYVAEEQSRFYQRQKLDLSNIKPAERKQVGAEPTKLNEKVSEPPKAVPQPIVTHVSIPLTPATASLVVKAQREALRKALLSLKPRASVLRDPIFDALTASSKPPFAIKSAEVQIVRAKPVTYNVTIVEPPASKSSPSVEVFVRELEQSLNVSAKAL